MEDGWHRANGEFQIGSAAFEEMGMYSEGYAPAKSEGKWGVVDTGNDWLIPPEYDQIIQDELGRCYAQQAVFVRQGDEVLLLVDGKQVGSPIRMPDPLPTVMPPWSGMGSGALSTPRAMSRSISALMTPLLRTALGRGEKR